MIRFNFKGLFVIMINLVSILDLYSQEIVIASNRSYYTFEHISKNEPFYFFSKPTQATGLHCYSQLENELIENVHFPNDILCRNNLGIFAFKVNNKGKVSLLNYYGDLDSAIVKTIKYNIRQTEGRFKLPTSRSSKQFHWFVLPFRSNGKDLNYQSCLNFKLLESEYKVEKARFAAYQYLNTLLPENSSITFLREKNHYFEFLSDS